MGEAYPSDVNPALRERGIRLRPAKSEAATLEGLQKRRRAKLRRSVFKTFQELTGIQEGMNWAIFNVPPKAAPGEEVGQDQTREILVVVDARDPVPTPDIRIITNEYFEAGGRGQYLTEDFTLDREHDARIFVDAVELLEEDQRDEMTHASVFWAETNNEASDGDWLKISNYADFTQVHVVAVPGEERTVAPFGDIEYVLDQLDALDAARGIISELAHGELLYYGVQPDIYLK